jgi:hypothetical protein
MRALGRVTAWLAAALVATLLGTIVQTQFNLAALQALNVHVSGTTRLQATAHDLVGFSPVYGALVAITLLLALTSSGLLARRWPSWRIGLHMLAGFAGVVVMLLLMNALLPVTVIAATRSLAALLLMATCAGLAGWVFARLAPQTRRD